MSDVDVLVAGAGPAGLCVARAAARAGRSVLVLDGDERPDHGSGLTLWPNALAALELLGLRRAVERAGRMADGMVVSRPDGRVLQHVDAATMAASCGGNGLALTRAALLECLGTDLPPAVQLRHEVFVGARDEGAQVLVRGTHSQYRAAVLVGADGARSTVRQVLGAPDALRHLGMRLVRGLSGHRLANRPAEVRMGRGLQFGLFCVPDGTYWFAAGPAPRRAGPRTRVDVADVQQAVGRLFGDWHDPVPRLLTTTETADVLVHDVVDRAPPGPTWGRGRITLAGDAAHLAAPTLGQGTCHAIEDAVALGHALSGGLDPARLRAYEAARTPRSASMVRRSHLAAVTGQWDGALVCALRDLAMRATPVRAQIRQLRSMFAFEAGEVLLPETTPESAG